MATVVLGVVVPLLGLLPWPRPVWAPDSGRMVTDVPAPLWAFVLGTTVVCLAAAVVLTVQAAHLRLGDVVTWVWIALVLLAAAALVWNAAYAAALSTIEFGALIPIFHWLFTFAPAVLAGWLFSPRGSEARWAAALGTGVVTVPLFALPSALLSSRPSLAGIAGVLGATAVLGVAPLIGGVALAGGMGREPALADAVAAASAATRNSAASFLLAAGTHPKVVQEHRPLVARDHGRHLQPRLPPISVTRQIVCTRRSGGDRYATPAALLDR